LSNYTKSTNFATKDNLTPGDPLKIVRGTEIDTEFNNIATAIATKTDNASAAVTGGTINDTTIGATTASTGAFTTLAASGNVTLSGGTANGVAYLNGSKVVTSGSALTFDGTTLATTGKFGITGNGSVPTSSALEIGTNGAGSRLLYNVPTSGEHNFTVNGSVISFQTASTHGWYISGSEQMRLTSTGLGIGTSSIISGQSGRGNVTINGSTDAFLVLGTGGTRKGGLYTQGTQLTLVNDTATLTLETSGSTRATIDSSGNLGLGVTPSAWTTFKVMQLGNFGAIGGVNSTSMNMFANTFYDGAFKYINTAAATRYRMDDAHSWFTAPSGTAGNAITFSQAMTLDASGNLGIGVTSPATRISVSNSRSDTAGTGWFTYTNVSETSARRGMRVDTNNAYCFDYYNGSSWSEQMRIDSSGNLLVGCTSTSFANGTHTGLFLTNNTGGDGGLAIRNTSNNTGTKVVRFFGWDGSETGSIQTYVNVTTYNTSSDYRLKNITGSLTGYKERLMSLQPKQGTWIANGSEFRGFLAHEFANPYRASVTGEKDAVDANGKPEYQGMQASSAEVMADLVALVQEQQAIIENLKARLDAANL
jgi:hypothetical protein